MFLMAGLIMAASLRTTNSKPSEDTSVMYSCSCIVSRVRVSMWRAHAV